ncbi:MAG: bifunctional tetrahydrofolate synthase/dihydrofolate synthase [Methylophilaceae bacterium]
MNDLTSKPKSLTQWLDYIEVLHPKAIAMGLDRVEEVASRLRLNLVFPVISIAGTNGKGSTCAMLESIYLKSGYRVGAYISPHLTRYNERVRVNQEEISDEDLCAAFGAVEEARGEVVLTYFEMGTLAAMWHFAQTDLDIVLLEVGMGGRLDAVNVFEPTCSIVTSIDLDHMDFLGDTREKIGAEKAGIFRASKLAICGDSNPPKSVVDYASTIGADFHLISRDFEVKKLADGWQYTAGDTQLTLPPLALQGDFQLNNAACAICAVQNLNNMLPVTLDNLGDALKVVKLLGRFYTLSESPKVIIDVAHNPQAAESLAQNLKQNICEGRTIGVFAMLADKDIAHVVHALASHIDIWYLADTNNARGASAKDLQFHLQSQAKKGLTKCFENVASALRSAYIDCGKNDRIIAFGSFYTVADALEAVNTQGI